MLDLSAHLCKGGRFARTTHEEPPMIRFQCPSCQVNLSAPDEAAGRSSRCSGCRGAVTVPAAPQIPEQHVTVNMPESEPPENLAPRLAIMAALLWVIVFFAALIYTAFGAWLGVRALMLAASSSGEPSAALVAVATMSLQLWFQVIVTACIAAYALDRILQ